MSDEKPVSIPTVVIGMMFPTMADAQVMLDRLDRCAAACHMETGEFVKAAIDQACLVAERLAGKREGWS